MSHQQSLKSPCPRDACNLKRESQLAQPPSGRKSDGCPYLTSKPKRLRPYPKNIVLKLWLGVNCNSRQACRLKTAGKTTWPLLAGTSPCAAQVYLTSTGSLPVALWACANKPAFLRGTEGGSPSTAKRTLSG